LQSTGAHDIRQCPSWKRKNSLAGTGGDDEFFTLDLSCAVRCFAKERISVCCVEDLCSRYCLDVCFLDLADKSPSSSIPDLPRGRSPYLSAGRRVVVNDDDAETFCGGGRTGKSCGSGANNNDVGRNLIHPSRPPFPRAREYYNCEYARRRRWLRDTRNK